MLDPPCGAETSAGVEPDAARLTVGTIAGVSFDGQSLQPTDDNPAVEYVAGVLNRDMLKLLWASRLHRSVPGEGQRRGTVLP